MANAVDSAAANGYEGGGGGGSGRGPRLPRWTRQEILVLIQGKRVVESPGGRGRSRAGAALVGSGHPVEPKWAAVSAYCRRHGVDRGPVQCRKRWSNLAGDFKKIKEWDRGKAGGNGESFWVMRNDVRRERRLPGFFDREVFDILDGAAGVEAEAAEDEEVKGGGGGGAAATEEEEEEAVFDSGRTAGDDGLFSDYEEDKEAAAAEKGDEDKEPVEEEERLLPPAAAVMPLSEKRSEPSHQESSDPGTAKDKHPVENREKGSPSHEGHKRRRTTSQEAPRETNLQSQLIEVFEKNSRILTAHLEAQSTNYELDRDQRKDHADSLLGVLNKLADALGRIADKL